MIDEEYMPPASVMNVWRKQCSCAEQYRPCGGVMAGGLCDGLNDEDEDYEQYDYDPRASEFL